MKCKYCDGTGEHINDANRMTTCEFCGGTGEVQTTETKLKPCPFCGKEPVYIADGKVICVCGAMMKSFNDWKPFTNQEAVDRWNRRYKEQNNEK